ncbi:glycosyltransferase family 4 protein [Thermovibrio sp.]
MEKVAIFYKTYSKYGGQEKVIYDFSHFLAGKGYRVKVYSHKVKDYPENKNIKVKKVFVPNLGRGFRNLYFATYSYLKAKRLKREGYKIFGFGKTFYQDIFRAGGGVHRYYVKRASLKFSSPLKRKIYLLKKAISPSFWINNLIEKLTFESKELNYIIVPTLFVKEQILKYFSPKAEIILIRNGVDIEKFNLDKKKEIRKRVRESLGISEEEFLFSYVSTNFKLKGFEYLLKACSKLKNKGFKFKLIAAGEKNRYWEKVIERENLKDNVLLLGKVRNVPEILMASDAFVYPTLFDASSNAVLEAMATAIPVLTSRYSGTHELIEKDFSNFIINQPENPKEIADKMEFILKSDRKSLTKAGENVRQIVERFSKKEIFEKYESLIRKL